MDAKERLIVLLRDYTTLTNDGAEHVAHRIASEGLLAPEWVSVKERLPEEGQFVLATGHKYNNPMNTRWQIVSRFTKGTFPEFQSDFHDDTDGGAWAGETYTTHWQRLPQPPQADTGAKETT